MPRLRLAWSSWNYIKRTAYDEKGVVKAHDPHLSVYVMLWPSTNRFHSPTVSKQDMYVMHLFFDPIVNLTKPNLPPEQTG